MNNPLFDSDGQSDNLNDVNSSDSQSSDIDPARLKQSKKAIKKLFIILLTIGLIIGIVSSWVIVKLMQRYGLTDQNNNQLEQLQNRLISPE